MLKALELFGFKSFADRTRFDFASGITGVVGPNGSGKSNVVDAIKWILGDQSPKSLRGKEMTDVIFNGSTSRKPAGFAEAQLTFDNSRRILQLDCDEVVIGRRIYRSGEAEYLINRTPARLKDIRDLFLGTGAGTAAYSIIEQGRVDQLLQSSNSARRVVFEEAAGISRYKVRKVEAERKLERVAQNLLRLTDIVQEVETRLVATRAQASKAAKFREHHAELKQLRAGSAADDHRDHTLRLAQLDDHQRELEQLVAQLAEQAQGCEAQQRDFESTLVATEDNLRDCEHRAAEFREGVARHEATLRHQAQRLHELDGEYERLDQQQRDLADRVQQVAGELEQAEASLHGFEDALAERRDAVAHADAQAESLATELEALRQRREAERQTLLDIAQKQSALGSRAAVLESRWQERHASWLESQAAVERARAEQQQAEERRNTEQQRHDRAAELAAAHRQRLAALHAERASLQADLTEQRQTIAQLREERASLEARQVLLEELDRRQEGLGLGVRDLLALARRQPGGPFQHVLGQVSELVECDLENAALVDVALGARAQLVVVADTGLLVDAVRAGTTRLASRVGFLTLPQGGEPSPARIECLTPHDVPDLSGYPGVICRADELLRPIATCPDLPALLLADTWLVRSLEEAAPLPLATQGRCRFVTLQGELLEANGTLYLGSLPSDTAGLSRKTELRGVRTDLQRCDRQLTAAERSQVTVTERLTRLADEERQLQFDGDVAAYELAESRTAAATAELECERTTRRLAELDAELTRLAGELATLEPDLQSARAESGAMSDQQSRLTHSVAALDAELLAAEETLHTARARQTAARGELARFESQLQALRQSQSRLDQERFQRDLQHEEADRRFQLLAERRTQVEAEVRKTEELLQGLQSEQAELEAAVTAAQQAREAARQRRGELAQRDLELRHQLRHAEEQRHASQMRATELKHALSSIADRLRDEFQLEIAEVLAGGYSARALLRAQRAAESQATESQATLAGTAEPAHSNGDAADHVPGHDSAQSPLAGDPQGEPSADGQPGPEAGAGWSDADAAYAPETEEQAEADRQLIEEQINRLRRKLKNLGQVNAESLRELDELEARYARLAGQLQDLQEAKGSLEEIIRKINTESRRIFLECFEEIRRNFRDLFRKLFGGGEGDVVLENPDDVLECGIDVVARPPGKDLRSLSLLSGGEKTMAAVAMLLAIFKSKPSPFCILDEVDAALDEGNVNRYLNVLREFQEWTQFIVVTHNKRTMSGAEVLYGVTMEEAGVSKRMSVRFDDISEDGHFRAAA